ncbi:MAG: DNA-3-methyladenine glycosylase [Candidatus Limnocylindrales bacterium]
MTGRPLSRDLLTRNTLEAARALIGMRLVRGTGPDARVGRIVEVEAYVGREDLASHAHSGRTARNAAMFGLPGRAYVYLTYGMHHCLNVVTEPDGRPAALLLRAVEPFANADRMRQARLDWLDSRFPRAADERLARARSRVAALAESALASGPGLLCQAFSVTRRDNEVDLCDASSDLRLEVAREDKPLPVESGPRIGMGTVPEPWHGRPWRFYVPGNSAVSNASRQSRPRPSNA